MKQYPLVCICIPHFNNKDTIAETLDSLLKQTYKNIKIKIFDNASTDGSIELLRDYEKKYTNIEVFQNEKNIGGEANFTRCIEGLEGKYGAIYHADDLYHPNIIETQVKCLSKNNISAIFVRANLIDDNSNKIGEQFFPPELKKKNYYQFNFEKLFSLILKYDNFLITPSVMADTNIYKNRIKQWNGKKFKTSADLDVWLRFSEIKDIGIITNKLISYRVSSASFSYRTKFSRVHPRDMFLVIDYYLEKYKKMDIINFCRNNYEFLKFKDQLLVINNKILNNIEVRASDLKIFDYKILKALKYNRTNKKVFIYGLIVKLLLLLRYNKLLMKLIKKIYNIKKDI